MQITFVTDVGESYALEIDPNMEMENIMALLEAEVSAHDLIQESDCDRMMLTTPI
jgi:hypothetical protein